MKLAKKLEEKQMAILKITTNMVSNKQLVQSYFFNKSKNNINFMLIFYSV